MLAHSCQRVVAYEMLFRLARNQYQPYAEGKLNRELTADERARAELALQLAEDRARLTQRLIQAGKSETEAQRIGASTGFRTHGARYDASQEVNVTELGGHRFNTAGNRDLKLPTLELVPPVEPVPKAETLVEGETVSAAPEGVTKEIAQQEDADMSPEIALLPLGGMGQQEQQRPTTGGGAITNPSLPSGGSPSVAFLSPFNPDNYETFNSALIYGVMQTS